MTPEVNEALRKIRQQKPFILTITNYFPMGYVGSGIRSIGGFPLMCGAEEEVEELLGISKAVIINLGKLDNAFVKLSSLICDIANQKNIPIILDPVGAGASRYRTDVAIRLIKKYQISIIRGYPNEIASLLTEELVIQDKNHLMEDQIIIENAKSLSKKHKLTVVVSGKRHLVVNSNQIDQFNFDSALVQKVAGIGNLLSAIISVFHSVIKDQFLAAKNAVRFYAECVGPTSSDASGPASLIIGVIDRIYINAKKAQLFA
ncbi:hydroxyethylthiazole kinase [Legionella anisa]|uniref:hydroxyethylthiazole kinase n=1 Tax=Legionella anisa TaxID=28082 RepID=A0AAX0WUV7_9GAMM|nr:hydroxyethylthiazole kinase [Legionella anisa]AWN73879.1 hydroxyethylthiazole kinase [Legionella anisa]KTC67146.1 hydroxyethylthiazole kinase [Legionella anisa]MBN5937309.1 hydroxyethylthiazole kinase [Legionella anisa]MCW8426141.1 hydroxyethylthiazole kinase [Legionella anisa]MCW8448452.1 hydroxyethylthiazole kinase [Legionella anisa]